MEETKDLFLLRHGDTGFPGHYIGSTDVPITETGKEQIRKTGALLRGQGIAEIFCSPLLRCRQTLELLDLPCTFQYSDHLREIDFGRWEKKTFTDIVRLDKSLVDTWVKDPEGFTFPGGESLIAFTSRLALFKTQLEQRAENKILIVAHGGVIRHLLCLILGLDVANYLLFEVTAGSFCSLRLHNEGGVLTGFNIKG